MSETRRNGWNMDARNRTNRVRRRYHVGLETRHLLGGPGDDILIGGTGQNLLDGGTGNNVVI